jgi:hypothetical protein
LWVIVAYAHIATDPNDVAKDHFYDTLLDLVTAIPPRDVTFIMGDFNVQVSYDFYNWKGIIGQHNFPTKDDLPIENGLKLLSFCRHHRFKIASIFF